MAASTVHSNLSTLSSSDRRSRRRAGTSVEDLRDIVRDHWCRPRNPFDEVFPGIYIGDAPTALCISILKAEGIGYVLNAAEACSRCLTGRICGTCVRTRPAYYERDHIAFHGVAAIDEIGFPLWQYFQDSANFIEDAVNAGAKDVTVLKMKRINNVLNAAFGNDQDICVDTNEIYYSSRGHTCQFLGIPAMDLECFKLHYFFKGATDFIDEALQSNGKVLVHCREGISRSATLVIAYLMMKKRMTVLEAVKHVRGKRQIYPNDGFLEQLCDLDQRLRSQRGY